MMTPRRDPLLRSFCSQQIPPKLIVWSGNADVRSLVDFRAVNGGDRYERRLHSGGC